MLVRSIRRLSERMKADANAPVEPRKSASDRRRRESEKDLQARRYVSGVSLLAFFLSLAAGGIFAGIAGSPIPFVAAVLVGIFLLFSLKVANQWERAVVLRFGRFVGLKGPGLFILVPVVDQISQLVDQRVRVTDVSAESALTKDTVPVNVDAIVFWTVWDAQKAVLEVADFLDAIALSAQTALRETIGRAHARRDDHGARAARKAAPGDPRREDESVGITVQSVEIRDVKIPAELEDAMSRQAQAERERQARIILGTAETEISARFVEAGDAYKDHPLALHLRAMNMLYEAIKEKGSMVIVPSSAVETMGLGGLTGVTALGQQKRE